MSVLDGVVCVCRSRELGNLLRDLGEKMSGAEMSAYFMSMDKDNSSTIDLEEFTFAMEKYITVRGDAWAHATMYDRVYPRLLYMCVPVCGLASSWR